MQQAQPLEVLTFPLRGERLIEASAGTGKTFTIAALYLRLLLGLGREQAFARPLTVEEILVVTFTEAATEELKGRIRDNIHQLRLACLRGAEEGHDPLRPAPLSSTPLLHGLLGEITDLPAAAQSLLLAERQMDTAAIYTIHGFCQRMLSQNAFESGLLFNQMLIQDETALRRQACADFWRRYCYPLPLDIARVISKEFAGPQTLLHKITPYLQGEMPQLRQRAEKETLEQRHQQIISQIEQVKALWKQHCQQAVALISASDVNKRSYSKGNLPKWTAKMEVWAQQVTEDYQLPDCLGYFAQDVLHSKSASGQGPQHDLFHAVERLCQAAPLTLSDLLLAQALIEVRQSVQEQKQRRAEMGFDDLLSRLDSALVGEGGAQLAQLIRHRYPVSMIDEFQDTDPQQYRIFRAIYPGREQSALLLIGDPKQAIYAFRGADIFTYIRARKQIESHYTLKTNWRSSPGMVEAVNRLFERVETPFLFEQIPFSPVIAAEKNQQLIFAYRGAEVCPMRFWLCPGTGIGAKEYQQIMGRQCAAQIRDWLQAGQQGEAWLEEACLEEGKKRRALAAADITVIVRNRVEAALMRDELTALAIPSVYLSSRDTVFATAEAQDLLWLMQAVLAPERERLVRTALASHLFGLDACTLYQLNQDEKAWGRLAAEFSAYRRHWLQRGILPMIREVLTRRNLAENILAMTGGERRITDLLHLGELLQEASVTLESGHALVRWLAQQMVAPEGAGEGQQLRLESDRHLVQIVTVHKAKGLDYPVVCLPFISGFRELRKQQQALYHDQDHLQAVLDLNVDSEGAERAQQERLAEDMRLLYVALTRSVYHCSIGVAPLMTGQRKKEGETDLHHGALGYLLQRGQAGDASLLAESLAELCANQHPIEVVEVGENGQSAWQASRQELPTLAARQFNRQLNDEWRLTSYSALLQSNSLQRTSPLLELLPQFDIEVAGEWKDADEGETPRLTVHTFPKGPAAGTFLHHLLEEMDFGQPVEPELLRQKLLQQGMNENWLPVLQSWLQAIVSTPLSPQPFSLAALTAQEKQVEMQFYLPIDSLLQSESLYRLTCGHDPLSARRSSLDFHQVTGMLKGFIDLVFRWQGRYYLLDYKSNWLGPDEEAYSQSAMERAMCEHYYDLQYQIYTLALHRLLRQRLVDYDYQSHFGGVFYLFLRGIASPQSASPQPDPQQHGARQNMTQQHHLQHSTLQGNKSRGIFYCRPALELVQGMDRLFGIEVERG